MIIMSYPNRGAVSALNETTEEGEITEDVDLGDLAYDSVSSTSLRESQSPLNIRSEKRMSSRRKSSEDKLGRCTRRSSRMSEKRRSRVSSQNSRGDYGDSRHPRSHMRDKSGSRHESDESSHKNTKSVLHRTKVSNVISELNSSKSADVIFISDEDRQTHGFVSGRRGSAQEKENSGSHRRSKSSDKDSKCLRKKCKHRKNSSRCSSDYHLSHECSVARKKPRHENPSKHRDKFHRHSVHDSESDVHRTDSSRQLHSPKSPLTKIVDHAYKSLLKESVQKNHHGKGPQRETEVISSESLIRFKDNILMRKLLESGTIRSRRDSGGSDLNCEVGSISSVSSPEFNLFEDVHIHDEDSLNSNEANKKTNENEDRLEISDDSEIEVIIPEKKVPELIDLKSDSESEAAKPDIENIETCDQLCSKDNLICVDLNQINECVSLDSPSPCAVTEAGTFGETELNADNKNDEKREVKDNNLQTLNTINTSEKECESENINIGEGLVNKNNEQPSTVENRVEDEDDMQLRLVALRSAVLKKHMDRLQKRSALKSGTAEISQKGEVIQLNVSKETAKSDSIENIVDDKVGSPLGSAYCPTNRTSPYSPTSSFSLSLGGENDNNDGEQDMEIAATDEDEAGIDEQNVQVSSYSDISNPIHDENKITTGDPEFHEHLNSVRISSQILAVDINSYDSTVDSVDPKGGNNFNEVPPQPLPPGVELSNLPPEFSHSLVVSQETINNNSIANSADFPSVNNEVTHSMQASNITSPLKTDELNSQNTYLPSLNNEFFTKSVQQGYYDSLYAQNDCQNFLLQSQVPVCVENKSYFCDNSRMSNDKNDIESQEFTNNKYESVDPPVIMNNDILSVQTCQVSNICSDEPMKETLKDSNDSFTKERRLFELGDSQQDCGNFETLTRSSLHNETSKPESENMLKENELLVPANIENKSLSDLNFTKSVITSTVSEKSHDSFQEEQEEDDENVLRANLLNSLENARSRSLSNENLVLKPGKIKSIKANPKTIMKKRIVVGRPLKRNANSLLRNNNQVGFKFGKKKFKESLQITLPTTDGDGSNLKKSVVRRRQIIPTNPVNNSNSKFIIKVGEDSDSAEEQDYFAQKSISSNFDGDSWLRRVSIRDTELTDQPSSSVKSMTATCPPELEKSVDMLLRQVRKQHEIKTKNDPSLNKNNFKIGIPVGKRTVPCEERLDNLTPLAVRHLPKSQQEEYRRLKQQILEKERLKRLKPSDEQQSLPLSNSVSLSNVSSLANQQGSAPAEVSSFENEKLCTSKTSVGVDSENLCANCRQKIVSDSNSGNSQSRDTLTELEARLINERFRVIDNILDMDVLNRKYDQQAESYDSASKEVSRLREQLLVAERHLENCKKELDSSKKAIFAGHKKLCENRLRYSQSEKSCNELGSQILGDSYILPKVASELMKKRLAELLRIRKKYLTDTDHIKDYETPMSFSLSGSSEGIANKRQLANTSPASEEFLHAKKFKEDISLNSRLIVASVEDNAILSVPDSVSESGLMPYVSPLTHLHGGLSRRPSSLGNSNHDAILCPYDLRGRCLDDACPYQH